MYLKGLSLFLVVIGVSGAESAELAFRERSKPNSKIVVADCKITSFKDGNFGTLLGEFSVTKDGASGELAYEYGELQVDAYDGAFKQYALRNTSVRVLIEKDPEDGFYTISLWGMTRNRSAEAETTIRSDSLPRSLDLKIASSENETKSAQTATAQQVLGLVRISCTRSKNKG